MFNSFVALSAELF